MSALDGKQRALKVDYERRKRDLADTRASLEATEADLTKREAKFNQTLEW